MVPMPVTPRFPAVILLGISSCVLLKYSPVFSSKVPLVSSEITRETARKSVGRIPVVVELLEEFPWEILREFSEYFSEKLQIWPWKRNSKSFLKKFRRNFRKDFLKKTLEKVLDKSF